MGEHWQLTLVIIYYICRRLLGMKRRVLCGEEKNKKVHQTLYNLYYGYIVYNNRGKKGYLNALYSRRPDGFPVIIIIRPPVYAAATVVEW